MHQQLEVVAKCAKVTVNAAMRGVPLLACVDERGCDTSWLNQPRHSERIDHLLFPHVSWYTTIFKFVKMKASSGVLSCPH